MDGPTVYGYWTCTYCGRENRGDVYNCPGCGKQRGKDVKFCRTPRTISEPVRYTTDNPGPDWVCSYCDSSNRADRTVCVNCGHPRDESDKDYYEYHPERRNIIPLGKPDEATSSSTPVSTRTPSNNPDDEPENDTYAPGFSDWDAPAGGYNTGGRHGDSSFPHSEEKPQWSSSTGDNVLNGLMDGVMALGELPWHIIAAAGAAVLLLFSVITLMIPVERDVTVIDKNWERKVVVEELRTFHEEDWSVPAGGRQTGSYRAFHHYETVFDHYETVTKYRQVPNGGHYESDGYRDNGNGTFTEQRHWVTDYKTEAYTEQEAKYRDEPVYKTKYKYDIDRWTFDHYEITSGHTDEPYFAEPTLAKNYRTNGTREQYTVTATYEAKRPSFWRSPFGWMFTKDGESRTDVYTMDLNEWRLVEIGQSLHAKIYFGSNLEVLPPEEQ